MKIMTKSVRIPDDLICRLNAESSRTGRTRNAELVVLLEEAIIEMKYSCGHSLESSGLMSGDETLSLSGGDSYQLRIPQTLQRIILHHIPAFRQETFSEKVRYLLLVGLSSRGSVIPVELESIRGNVYQDKEIETKFSSYKKGRSQQLDQMLTLGELFTELMQRTSGHVLIYGEPGTGKSFCSGYYKAANSETCHFLDLMPQGLKIITPRRVVLLWANDKNHNEKKTLILDNADHLDNDYFLIFLKKTRKKNVRVFLIGRWMDSFSKDALELIENKIDFNRDINGRLNWVNSLQGN